MRPPPCCPSRPLAAGVAAAKCTFCKSGGLASAHRHRCPGCSFASWHQCLGFLDLGRKKTCDQPLQKPDLRSSCSSSSGPVMRPNRTSKAEELQRQSIAKPSSAPHFLVLLYCIHPGSLPWNILPSCVLRGQKSTRKQRLKLEEVITFFFQPFGYSSRPQ